MANVAKIRKTIELVGQLAPSLTENELDSILMVLAGALERMEREWKNNG
mgnify:CR=1 FL=1